MKISDAAVEAACEKYSIYLIPRWENQSEGQKAIGMSLMRAALQAALGVMKAEGQLVTIDYTPPEAGAPPAIV